MFKQQDIVQPRSTQYAKQSNHQYAHMHKCTKGDTPTLNLNAEILFLLQE